MSDSGAPRAILADTLYTGDACATGRAIVVRDGRIVASIAAGELPPDVPVVARAPIVAPGFIDIQINGACDVLFNDAPTAATLARIAAGAAKGGTTHLLPTFITAPPGDFRRAMTAVAEARHAGLSAILGVHLEGPFLSSRKPGIHRPQFMRGMTVEDAADIVARACGVTLVTLAPEMAKDNAIAALVAGGVRVFMGHTAGAFDDFVAAARQGASGFTHLFNAMTPATGREPGAVGAALHLPNVFASIIADGLHVHDANLHAAARLLGPQHLILVTDAMPTLEGRETSFSLFGRQIELRCGRLVAADGTLAGAHLAMDEAVAHMIGRVGIAPADALSMASLAPATALGLDAELGRIRPGYRASLTLLDQRFNAIGAMTDGHLS